MQMSRITKRIAHAEILHFLHILNILENEKIINKINEKEKLIRLLLIHKKIKKINGTVLMLAIILESQVDKIKTLE